MAELVLVPLPVLLPVLVVRKEQHKQPASTTTSDAHSTEEELIGQADHGPIAHHRRHHPQDQTKALFTEATAKVDI